MNQVLEFFLIEKVVVARIRLFTAWSAGRRRDQALHRIRKVLKDSLGDGVLATTRRNSNDEYAAISCPLGHGFSIREEKAERRSCVPDQGRLTRRSRARYLR